MGERAREQVRERFDSRRGAKELEDVVVAAAREGGWSASLRRLTGR
jgi:hypothetical protein